MLMAGQKIKLIPMAILVICSLTLTILSAGCSRISLYPLEGDHIINVKAGEEFTAPRDGYFLSDEYFKKVLKAKVGEF